MTGIILLSSCRDKKTDIRSLPLKQEYQERQWKGPESRNPVYYPNNGTELILMEDGMILMYNSFRRVTDEQDSILFFKSKY